MKSAKQTEQKIATVEATLLQRRKYLESIKVHSGFVGKGLICLKQNWDELGGCFKYCLFSPLFGEDGQCDYIYNMFQMG